MSAFGDQLAEDARSVFLNGDEWGSTHRIEGEDVVCLIDEPSSDAGHRDLAIAGAGATLYVPQGALACGRLRPGSTLEIDDLCWIVESWASEAGMEVASLTRSI